MLLTSVILRKGSQVMGGWRGGGAYQLASRAFDEAQKGQEGKQGGGPQLFTGPKGDSVACFPAPLTVE